MNLSVILCTYNRCQSLLRALESIAASQLPDSVDWQVLIINNNSEDQTHELAEGFCRRHSSRFRYVFEAQQGKSFALNRGIQEATGEVLVFTDDDIIAEPNWLFELTKPFADPRWAGVGGRVFLPKDFVPPSWMALQGENSLLSILAHFDLGAEPLVMNQPPIGNNMAFRKSTFAKYGGFRTDLGPSPGNELRHEDTEFGWRVMKGGDQILYVPSAVVRHAVEERRLGQDYFLAYHFDYGRALVRNRGYRKPIGIIPRVWISFFERLFRMLPKKLWWWFREPDPRKKFFNKCAVWATAGEIAELSDHLFGPSATRVTPVANSAVSEEQV